MTDFEPTTAMPPGRFRSRWLKRVGTMLIIGGIAVLAWSFLVWRWNDPLTSLYTRWQQGQLSDRYASIVAAAPKSVVPRTTSRAEAAEWVERAAGSSRRTSSEGDPIGRLVVPRLSLNAVVVNGTTPSTLRRGPGRDPRTYLPGQGQLVYIAGHRTTYGAPFARITALRRGDRVRLEMPYGTFVYAVTRHRIVEADDLSVLKTRHREEVALQACHPRFFATQRYIVWALPVSFKPREGRAYLVSRHGRASAA